MSDFCEKWLMPLTLTLILIGYLGVWMPGDVAGLRLIGWEVGEWVKFLPAFKQAAFSPDLSPPTNRNWFYIPPIMLALSLLLWTADWRNNWQTWLTRLFAIPIAFLAVPDIPIIVDEDIDQWIVRVGAFGVVCLMVLIAPFFRNIVTLPLCIFATLGATLPFAAYQATRWHIEDLLQMPVGIGWGLWLNVIGHLLLLGCVICTKNSGKGSDRSQGLV